MPRVAAGAVKVARQTPVVIVFAAGCRLRFVAFATAVRSCLAPSVGIRLAGPRGGAIEPVGLRVVKQGARTNDQSAVAVNCFTKVSATCATHSGFSSGG